MKFMPVCSSMTRGAFLWACIIGGSNNDTFRPPMQNNATVCRFGISRHFSTSNEHPPSTRQWRSLIAIPEGPPLSFYLIIPQTADNFRTILRASALGSMPRGPNKSSQS